MMKLWYEKEARRWEEALPIGNGRLGAMVFGGIKREQIALNEDTLWSGYPREYNPENTASAYREIVQDAMQRRFKEAQQLAEQKMTADWTQSYLPLGNLWMDFDLDDAEICDYQRSLDLNTAMAETTFTCREVCYRREVFASFPDQLIMIRLTADKPGKQAVALTFDSQLRSEVVVEDNEVTVSGIAPSCVEPSYSNEKAEPVEYGMTDEDSGMRFIGQITVKQKGGCYCMSGKRLQILSADEVLIFLNCETSFVDYKTHPFLNGKDEKAICRARIESAISSSWDDLMKRHLEDYQELFKRVYLDLGSNDRENLPTDKRLLTYKENQEDPSLPVLLFQYGRYLMIAASREGTQAMNLQGIWNPHLRAPWSSNYTLNINTEMNYWPAFSCNLGELQEPLNRLIAELCENGKVTAEKMYGVQGFVSHHNTDLWRLSSPVGNKVGGSTVYAFWNASAGWLCRHLYEQYEYTDDVIFLRESAYPIMEQAVLYLMNILVEDSDGSLIIPASTSPENSFIYQGKVYNIAKYTTMSMTIAKELFRNYLEASEILGIRTDFINTVESALKRLKPYETDCLGRLKEWDSEYEENEKTHRHISHLYGFYPSSELNMEDTPALAQAVRKSLEHRGDDGTGWSLGWKIAQWARLQDGNHARKLIARQLRYVVTDDVNMSNGGGTYANLFDAHPPFQIDGNFAASAGIAEMLLQSRSNRILILPALPDSWAKGCVSGLMAKHQIQTAIRWDQDVVEVDLETGNSCEIKLSVCSGDFMPLALEKGRKTHLKISRSSGLCV